MSKETTFGSIDLQRASRRLTRIRPAMRKAKGELGQ
jgi:hypothetical protein